MTESEEIRMPDDPSRLVQHGPIAVRLTLLTRKGERRPVLGGRCTTHHLRPNGAIVEIRPQIAPPSPLPLKRRDTVEVELKLMNQPPLRSGAEVSWVRPKAFLPNGLAVSLVGLTFDWNPGDMALEVAAFVTNASANH